MELITTYLVRVLLHMVFITGVIMLIWPVIDPMLKGISKNMDYRIQMKVEALGSRLMVRKKTFRLFRHLESLLYLVRKNYQPGLSLIQFLSISLLVFIVALISLLLTIGDMPNRITFGNPFTEGIDVGQVGSTLNWQFPFLGATLFMLIPYIHLRYQYSIKKVKSSYDLLEVVRLLSKFTHLSIDSALSRTSQMLDDSNVLKRPLLVLSGDFAGYNDDEELKEGAKRFSNSIGTTFSVSFISDLLYYEKEGGQSWKESLLFLISIMEAQRNAILEVKNSNRDAIALGSYGNLLVFLMLTITLIFFLGFNVYFDLQFKTEIGLWSFMIVFATMFISFVFGYLLSRPRLDYH